jgi:hypothetical protein
VVASDSANSIRVEKVTVMHPLWRRRLTAAIGAFNASHFPADLMQNF